ncbi:hypothetical protein [Desmospora profundinema]|uniref:Uncharacterized protein n=1 Tax=Desmospora profundinema TaxID=1571184 RepID=A0ABU1ILY4_9BACL|nr:hypothetical protein [Desmospora profundinema]MDR6225577.1 hypothetical protein [Desmospora profundinema]
MIIDWLTELPVMVWFGLAAGLVGILVIMVIINYKRSHEVDELQKAFGEPYDYPEEEEGEKLERKSVRKRKEASSKLEGSSSKAKEANTGEPLDGDSPPEKEVVAGQPFGLPEGKAVKQEPKKRERDKEPDSADPVDETVMKPEEKKGESSPEPEKTVDVGLESIEAPRKRVHGRKVSSTRRDQSVIDPEEKEKKGKADTSWATLSAEPLPPRGSRHGRNRRASSDKK